MSFILIDTPLRLRLLESALFRMNHASLNENNKKILLWNISLTVNREMQSLEAMRQLKVLK